MWYIHRVEYDSTVKEDKVLILVTMWGSLVKVKLSERSQKQRATYWRVLFI